MTASASRRFGTAFGETNEVTSIFATPVSESASISSILRSVGTKPGSIWKPSRVTTSWMKRCCTLDRPAFPQSGDVSLCIAVRREHRFGVLAQARADPADVAGRRRELRHDPGHLQRRAVGQLDLADHI